jgi:hypothetical protein
MNADESTIGSFSPEPFWLVSSTKFYSGLGADIVIVNFTNNPVLGANAVYNNDRLESPTEVQPLRLVTANASRLLSRPVKAPQLAGATFLSLPAF